MCDSVSEVCEFYDELMQDLCDLCYHHFHTLDDEELRDMFCSRCKVIKTLEIIKEKEIG